MRATDWTLHSHYAIVATAIAIINLCAGVTSTSWKMSNRPKRRADRLCIFQRSLWTPPVDGSKELIMAERLWKRTPETVIISRGIRAAGLIVFALNFPLVSLERSLFTYIGQVSQINDDRCRITES